MQHRSIAVTPVLGHEDFAESVCNTTLRSFNSLVSICFHSRLAKVNNSRLPEFQIVKTGNIPDWKSGILEELVSAYLEVWNSGSGSPRESGSPRKSGIRDLLALANMEVWK